MMNHRFSSDSPIPNQMTFRSRKLIMMMMPGFTSTTHSPFSQFSSHNNNTSSATDSDITIETADYTFSNQQTFNSSTPYHNCQSNNYYSSPVIVQQKQAAVKRDTKVKALVATEAAKRLQQEKEYQRKMKKEALKIKMELNKKKKQLEELKKKEAADVAARKNDKKRKIARKVQDEKGKNVAVNNKKSLADVIQQHTSVAVFVEKETNILETHQTSYQISPYQSSDDDLPTNKFVPSWASKEAVGMVLALQLELDSETIFSIGSFCSINQVLLQGQ